MHGLIERAGVSFILTGSSARKLRRGHANLLGGRAWRYVMTPLCYPEIEGYDLGAVMRSGLLPPHVLCDNPWPELRAYTADYLKEEIAGEGLVQHIPAFADFLKVAAITSGELIHCTNIARETGVSAKVVRRYFQILDDTLLGHRLQPWRRAVSRRMVDREKFYWFDVGVVNYLLGRVPQPGTSEYGKAFEHVVLHELKAFQAYKNPEMEIHFWRTERGHEVDFILGDMEVAIEVKASGHCHEGDARQLLRVREDHAVKKQF